MAPKKKAEAEAEDAAKKEAELEAAQAAEEAARQKAAQEEADRIAAEEAGRLAALEAEERVIPDLLIRVRQGTPVECNKALKELCERCEGDLEAQDKVTSCGGMQSLIDTIIDGLPGQKEWAVRALVAATSLSVAARERVMKIKGIPALVTLAGASWSTATHKELAACVLRNLVSEGNVQTQNKIVSEGGLKPLAKLASRNAGTGQQIAARNCLCQIARGSKENLMKVQDVLGVPLLVDMVLRGYTLVKEMAVEMLGCYESGTVELLNLTKTGTNGQPEVALHALVDLCIGRMKQTVQLILGNSGGTEVLLDIIATGSTSVKQAATATLGSMVDGHSGNQSLVGAADGVHILMGLITTGNHAQKAAASRALGNLTAAHEANRQDLVAAQGVELLLNQAKFGHGPEKEAALFAISKIVTGSYEAQSDLAARGAIPKLAQLASTGPPTIKEAAAQALAAICAGHPENKRRIAEEGSIPQLLGLVERGTPGQQYAAASTLGVIAFQDGDMQARMAEHGGVSKLLQLQRSGGPMQRRAASLAMLRAAGGSPIPDGAPQLPQKSRSLTSSLSSSSGFGHSKRTPLLSERGLRRTGSAVLFGQKSGSSWVKA